MFYKYCFYYPAVFIKTKNFFTCLDELNKSQYFSKQQLDKRRLEKLNSIVEFAKSNIPYYKKSLAHVENGMLTSVQDIDKLPFINKVDLKTTPQLFVPQNKSLFVTSKTTGGSTGQPVTILKTREAMGAELAATWRGYSWAGVKIGDMQARFWGLSYDARKARAARVTDFVCNRIRLSAFSYTSDTLSNYRKILRDKRPDYYYGYVSMLVEYAGYIRTSSAKNRVAKNLKAIITTSEVLHKSQKELLEDTFGVKVYNEYGCGEIGTIAHECEYGNMHVSDENIILETINDSGVCAPGEVGEIVVTELSNKAFPLIRYRLGDYGSVSDRACPCGRNLQILDGLKGRAYDIVESPDGRKFHGEFFMYIFEDAERMGLGVAKFQVIQEGLEQIRIKIVPGHSYKQDELEKLVREYVGKNLGTTVHVVFEVVEDISREMSGKMRLIVGLDSL